MVFSELAQNIISYAEKEAGRLNHSFINTGHILLALVKNTSTVAYQALSNLGISLAKTPSEIEVVMTQQQNIEWAEAGLTDAVKRTIELAVTEAKHLGAEKVEPEHILLGLIRQKEGLAPKLLKNRRINVERVYGELIRLYTQSQVGQQA